MYLQCQVSDIYIVHIVYVYKMGIGYIIVVGRVYINGLSYLVKVCSRTFSLSRLI